jgi:suppressor for copper-sensitivity B
MPSPLKHFLNPLVAAIILLPLLMAAASWNPARAQGTSAGWQGTEDASARLFTGQTQLDAMGRIWLGVEIKLAPGWKTYWRNPGESGAPPRFDWQGSQNLDRVEVRWPAPHRFSSFGFDSFGYDDGVVLPVLLQAAAPGQPLRARLNLEYMVCKNICVPMQAKFDLNLPAGGAATKSAAPVVNARVNARTSLIKKSLALVPTSAEKSGLRIDSAVVRGPAGGQILRISATAQRPFTAPDLMVEAPEPFGFGRPEVTLGKGGHDVTLDLVVYAGTGKAALTDQALILTLVDGGRAVERQFVLGQ